MNNIYDDKFIRDRRAQALKSCYRYLGYILKWSMPGREMTRVEIVRTGEGPVLAFFHATGNMLDHTGGNAFWRCPLDDPYRNNTISRILGKAYDQPSLIEMLVLNMQEIHFNKEVGQYDLYSGDRLVAQYTLYGDAGYSAPKSAEPSTQSIIQLVEPAL